MKTRTLLFEQISILEWHDGLVRAIGTQKGKYYLLTLAAWDLGSARKVYVLLKLDGNIADAMMKLLNLNDKTAQIETWNEFNKQFDDYLSNYTEEVLVTFEEPIAGRKLSVMPTSADNLKNLRDYDVENSVSLSAAAFLFGVMKDTA